MFLQIGNSFKIIGITVIFFAFAQISAAQITTEPSSDIQLRLNPKFPGPHETVRVEAISYSFDTRTASFSWYVNGKSAGSGTGVTSISVTTGGVGSQTNIEVAATSVDEKEFSKTTTIRPSDLDMLWSADTYTPAGYPGKALPSPESVVTIFAQPLFSIDGSSINSSKLLYEWSLDGIMLKDKSGLGRNTFSIFLAGNSNIEHSVKVRVSDDEEQSVREKVLTIRAHHPHIAFYELDPLRGPLYHKNVPELAFPAGSNIKILAVPFFANTFSLDALSYTWSINGIKLPPASIQPYILSYRTREGSVADQLISLEVRTASRRIAPTNGSFKIHVQ